MVTYDFVEWFARPYRGTEFEDVARALAAAPVREQPSDRQANAAGERVQRVEETGRDDQGGQNPVAPGASNSTSPVE